MELSSEVHCLLEKFRLLKKQSEESVSSERSIKQTSNYNISVEDNDLIDVNSIEFSSDEYWLYKPDIRCSSPVKDLDRWLTRRDEALQDEYFHKQHLQMVREMAKLNSHKTIDSRTFTRPKKKNSRSGFEQLQEDMMERNGTVGNETYIASRDTTYNGDSTYVANDTPLAFDLTQPTKTSMFDSILAAAPDLDSFQNMSPPSLVNSICSSTFNNLMENSFIKNDPVLREIRDTDYSDAVLLQDSDPPLFQSIDGSCSSVYSDMQENPAGKSFVKNKSPSPKEEVPPFDSFEGSLDGNGEGTPNEFFSPTGSPSCYDTQSQIEETIILNRTNDLSFDRRNVTQELPTITSHLNGTFKKNTKIDEMNYSTDSLDDYKFRSNTFTRSSKKVARNSTFSKPHKTVDIQDVLSNTVTISPDRNVTYQTVESHNATYELNQTVESKRNSFGNSAGSADSLDRMSSLSDSSKGSSKMLNMADVEAIATRQEMSLQLFSTPKQSAVRKLAEPLTISPIKVKEPCSDSELSSNEDYASVRTHLSKVSSLVSVADAANYRLAPKSNPHLARDGERLKKFPAGGQPLLPARSAKGSLTNLRSTNSRGSCTSLRPASTLDVTTVLSAKESAADVEKNVNKNETFKVPAVRDACRATGDSALVNPQPRSNLPRPVTASTGIPRPVSRIPGPRTLRSAVSRTNLRPSKTGNENLY